MGGLKLTLKLRSARLRPLEKYEVGGLMSQKNTRQELTNKNVEDFEQYVRGLGCFVQYVVCFDVG